MLPEQGFLGATIISSVICLQMPEWVFSVFVLFIGTILYYRGNSQTKKMGSSLVFALFYNGWQGCPSFSIQL
ncbi:hypothetical protein AC141_22420 [Bacteroides fragilis]|nr:hypothetical protein AC141_22420 [Bacteroides fragilis]